MEVASGLDAQKPRTPNMIQDIGADVALSWLNIVKYDDAASDSVVVLALTGYGHRTPIIDILQWGSRGRAYLAASATS